MSLPIPDYTLQTNPGYQTVVSVMENGYEQRRPQRSRVIHTFKLIYKNRYQSDIQAVLALFNTGLGQYGTFSWTCPDDGNTYNVRFKSDSLPYDLKAGQANNSNGLYDFNFELVEVLT